MKILFLTLGDKKVASSRTRVYQYIPHLNKKGVSTKVIKYMSGLDFLVTARLQPVTTIGKFLHRNILKIIRLFHWFYSAISVLRLLLLARRYDIIFIQKVLLPIKIQRLLLKLNERIVFDFDDAIYADQYIYDKDRLEHFVPLIKLAVVETKETQNYIEKFSKKTILITGPIDCDRYKPFKCKCKKYNSETIIGWIGSSSTTQYLRIVEKHLQEISKKFPSVVIELIGASQLQMDGVRIRNYQWLLANEIELLSRFDIGIMPLSDDEWTRGKGGYKLLQYMAMGIPCVASPVGINKELIRDGENGFLVTTGEEWFEKLSFLIENHDLRKKMGEKGRDFVTENYSFEIAVPKLIDALRHLR